MFGKVALSEAGMSDVWQITGMKIMLGELCPHGIFKVDETALFCNALPSRMLTFVGEKGMRGKHR